MSVADLLRGKRILVTGGAGLVGSAFVAELLEAGAAVRTVRHRRPVPLAERLEVVDGDLLDPAVCRRACAGVEAVIHTAGVSGGSRQVTVQPIAMFTDNLLLNTQVLEAARQSGVARYLFISNSSVYAPSADVLRESDAWGPTCRGVPENETGAVKRVGEVQCALYARTTDMQIAIMRAGNAYGPHDNFDLAASHVVPAIIRKAVEKQTPFAVWGNGEAVRDFIYTRDIARGGLFLLEHHPVAEPVNIATGTTVTIRELVELVLRLAGHADTPLAFDPGAPPASAAKRIDVGTMRRLGFAPSTSLEEGLRRTIAWYREHGSAP